MGGPTILHHITLLATGILDSRFSLYLLKPMSPLCFLPNSPRGTQLGRFLLVFAAMVSPLVAANPDAPAIVADMKRVADWQLANPSRHALHDWTQAPFYLGLANLTQVSGDAKYREAITGFGSQLAYGPGPRVTHADDNAVLQAWLEIYRLDKDPSKLAPALAHFDKLTAALSAEEPKSISGGSFVWCWCDALFMSPPVWSQLSQLTGDPKYLEWADREWWTTTDVLYDATHHLYYRDNRFFTKRTASGKKVFWSRGNGWVVGGIVHVLDHLPADHPSRTKYLGLYHDMMHALLPLQHEDGLWRTSLLDSQAPQGETSGSAFFIYAMTWGLNRGLLPAATFEPAVIKGYQALAKSIQPTGMLGFIQKIGDAPDEKPATANSTEVYGTGAFLLAGAELVRRIEPSKRRSDLATFDGVKLPDHFLPATPRTFARSVPERADDFAWENDLVAFRTYGPALRPGPENSGIDCWFKRVTYPIIDKWYLQDRIKLPYGNVSKSYHEDQGDGYDIYHVGDSRGCGGISVWDEGKLHNSDTYIGQRVLKNSGETVVFELDYASNFKGQILRETKRITLIMGERMFQCDARFTLDGQPVKLKVAIGLNPQVKGTQAVFSPSAGIMTLWETVDHHSLGTGIVLDPKQLTEMIHHTDGSGQQALCLATTDENGSIRWFAGFAWGGQGTITQANQWADYLHQFKDKFLNSPYADYSNDSSFKVHSHPIPATNP
jgi:unsaturated rhamnogalacturonyl hydrolase